MTDLANPGMMMLPFDNLAPALTRVEPVRLAPLGARDVTAAYVDEYRKLSRGVNPPRQAIGRVSQGAKALVEQGYEIDVLQRAAVDCARTGFTNMEIAVTKAVARNAPPQLFDPTPRLSQAMQGILRMRAARGQ